MSGQRITSSDIKTAMLAKFAPPEWAIMWEVGDATGLSQKRWADAVMMSIWPSRGLELHGVEIKVSTSDWKREAADPRKAEAVGQYCDRWWVHTPPGVVKDLAEVPPAWGLREWDGKRWATKREAAKNPSPAPITRHFLAALLRRHDGGERARVYEEAQRMSAQARQAVEDERAKIKSEIEQGVAFRTRKLQAIADQTAAFEAACGVSLAGVWGDSTARAKQVGLIVNAILRSGVTETYGGLSTIRDGLQRMLGQLEAAITESGIPIPEKERAA